MSFYLIFSDFNYNSEKFSCDIYRYEEDTAICPLWDCGSAVINSADGNWGQMYDCYVNTLQYIWLVYSFLITNLHYLS